MTDGDCPLARLCAEAERLIVRRNAAEALALRLAGVGDAAGPAAERNAAERVFEEATLSLDHVALRASEHRPQSRVGALFTLALAAAEVELLGADEVEARADHLARLKRRLWALRGFLETHAPETRLPETRPLAPHPSDAPRLPDGVATFYMPARHDRLAALGL
ncbi:hypothetical protein ACTZWW_12915 [Salinarimonas sp. NSM]|uniref:hypothetical protein n=1 Tax=Salinarimonas sp. NSM TaxID=3458003 RepID=UPI004036DEDD